MVGGGGGLVSGEGRALPSESNDGLLMVRSNYKMSGWPDIMSGKFCRNITDILSDYHGHFYKTHPLDFFPVTRLHILTFPPSL